jgi:8-oxo-dGTP diphosphatase
MILQTIERYYMWALIAILFLNMSQRKIPNSSKKRFATIWIATALLLFEIGTVTILTRGWNHNWAWLFLAICIALLYIFRARTFPFRLTCVECGAKLSFNRIIGGDENICQSCYYKAHPDAAPPVVIEEEPTDPYIAVDSVSEIDWEGWEPTDICVITYLFDDGKVLLIDKKTGLGKGLVNAPGGHIEDDETADEAAVREFGEETGLAVSGLTLVGDLYFQFKDGMRQRGYVYFASSHEGEMKETDEARPFWVDLAAIPYDKMWEDDIHWLPLAIEGKRVAGYFIFDGERMVDKRVDVKEEG